jgi:uncharacterized protein YndB with AHSA1/START domain
MAGRGDRGEGVTVSVDIAASPGTVWRCVTRSDLLSRWLTAEVALDPRVGGAVRIDFARHATVVEGSVEELREERFLAFTWGVSRGAQAATMPPGSTRVSISLEPLASGTRVTLRHDGLPSEKERKDHAFGWTSYLGSLAGTAPLAAVEGGPEALWDGWFAAWGETDAARRDALLARTATDGVRFRDAHAEGAGRPWLSGWMGMCQGMFPGTRLSSAPGGRSSSGGR